MSDHEELDVSSFSINRGWRDRRLSREADSHSRIDGWKAGRRLPSQQSSGAFGGGFGGSNWRGSRGGRGIFASKKQAPSISNRPLGNVVATVNYHLLDESIDSARISGCEYVASYNWLDRKEPIILVPGKSGLCLLMGIQTLTQLRHATKVVSNERNAQTSRR